MKAKTETELIADTALVLYSTFGSSESLLNLEPNHEMAISISVKVFLGVLQTNRSILENGKKQYMWK